MKKKSKTVLVVFIIFMVLFLVSCEEELMLQPLTEGIYYDGFLGTYVRLLEVDEFGEYYYHYPPADSLEIVGFACHDGKATSPWDKIDVDEGAVLHYLSGISSPIELYAGSWNTFYVVDEKAAKDWMALEEEIDKYAYEITLESFCECGIISLTNDGEEEANKNFIKSIRVLQHPYTGELREHWLSVKNKDLCLNQKYLLEKGFTTEILVELVNGYARETLIITLKVKGTGE